MLGFGTGSNHRPGVGDASRHCAHWHLRLQGLAASTTHGGFRHRGATTGQRAPVAKVAGYRLGTSASTSSDSIVSECLRKATTADQVIRDQLQPYSTILSPFVASLSLIFLLTLRGIVIAKLKTRMSENVIPVRVQTSNN